MNHSQLRQIIKEEISKALSENAEMDKMNQMFNDKAYVKLSTAKNVMKYEKLPGYFELPELTKDDRKSILLPSLYDSNGSSRLFTKKDVKDWIDKFKKKEDDYSKKIATFLQFISSIDDEEKKEIKKYKNLFQAETSTIKKNSLENEYQKILESFSRKKIERVDNIIEQTYIFHIFFMLLEEISFDNFVMTKRTTTNIEKMNALFA